MKVGKKTFYVVLGLMVLMLQACNSQEVSEKQRWKIEASIIKLIVNTHYSNRADIDMVVIYQAAKKSIHYPYHQPKAYCPFIQYETCIDFVLRNTKSKTAEKKLNLGNNYVYMSRKELADIFQVNSRIIFGKTGWKRFYEKFPTSGGFIRVSQVGFNKKLNQAFLYCEIHNNVLHAEAIFILLEKPYPDMPWYIKQEIILWIS